MGVSVGPRGSTRVYLPFWIAIPWALCVVVGWTLVMLVRGVIAAGGWAYRTMEARRTAKALAR